MSASEIQSIVLIPFSDVPASEVLMSGIVQPPSPPSHYPYSDLFPEINTFPPEDHDGPLGNYSGGESPLHHPAYAAVQGLQNAYYEFGQKEMANDWVSTEETSQGKIATLLQGYIAQCIAKGYSNLLDQNHSPSQAISVINGYIDTQSSDVSNAYKDRLDSCTVELAKLDRRDEEPTPDKIDGIPIISSNGILRALGKTPQSPEVERENKKAFCAEAITTLRHRIVRVKFEALSAAAITGLVAQGLNSPPGSL